MSLERTENGGTQHVTLYQDEVDSIVNGTLTKTLHHKLVSFSYHQCMCLHATVSCCSHSRCSDVNSRTVVLSSISEYYGAFWHVSHSSQRQVHSNRHVCSFRQVFRSSYPVGTKTPVIALQDEPFRTLLIKLRR
jgi:hypothetical protein